MPRRTAQGSGPEAGAVGLMEPGATSSPTESRPGAAISPDMVNVFEQAVSPGASPGLHLVPIGGRPAGDAIALSILAWVRNIAYDKEVWVDLYVLGEGGDVLHAETIPLAYQEPAEGGGDFFATGAAVPAPKAGSTGSSQRALQFRVYCQMNGEVFTDGLLHTHGIVATPTKKATPKARAATSFPPTATESATPAPAPVAKATDPKVAKPKAVAPKKASVPKAAAEKAVVEKAAIEPKTPAAPKARKPKKV